MVEKVDLHGLSFVCQFVSPPVLLCMSCIPVGHGTAFHVLGLFPYRIPGNQGIDHKSLQKPVPWIIVADRLLLAAFLEFAGP